MYTDSSMVNYEYECRAQFHCLAKHCVYHDRDLSQESAIRKFYSPTKKGSIELKSISAPIKANSSGCAICHTRKNARDTRLCEREVMGGIVVTAYS